METQKQEKTMECFSYIKYILHLFYKHQQKGIYKPWIYQHPLEGSINSLDSLAPTRRRLQPPCPCPILPPYDRHIDQPETNLILDIPFSLCTYTNHILLYFLIRWITILFSSCLASPHIFYITLYLYIYF